MSCFWRRGIELLDEEAFFALICWLAFFVSRYMIPVMAVRLNRLLLGNHSEVHRKANPDITTAGTGKDEH